MVNYDLLIRSIEYAEKFLFSYQYNPCEFCKDYVFEDCISCIIDSEIVGGKDYFNYIPIYINCVGRQLW